MSNQSPPDDTGEPAPAPDELAKNAVPGSGKRGSETPPPKRNPIRTITIAAISALSALLLYHVASDSITPYTAYGTVEAFVVEIAPRVSGQVVEVSVTDNEQVDRNESLFRIDPEPFRIAVDAAKAALDIAGQGVGQSIAGVAAAQAKVAERKADLDHIRIQSARLERLAKQGAAAQAMVDAARGEMAKAEAAVKNADAELERAKQSLGPMGAENPQIRAAVAALEKAEFELRFTTVIAPSDGLVTNLRMSVGQFANRGQPVMAFLDIHDIWLTAHFRENQLRNIKTGDPVDVALDVEPGRIFSGRVSSIGWGVASSAESTSGALAVAQKSEGWLRESQRFPVRISLDAERGGVKSRGIEGIRVGSQGSVIIYTDEGARLLNGIGKLWVRAVALLGFIY